VFGKNEPVLSGSLSGFSPRPKALGLPPPPSTMQRKVDNHFGSFLEGFQLGGEDPFGKYEKSVRRLISKHLCDLTDPNQQRSVYPSVWP